MNIVTNKVEVHTIIAENDESKIETIASVQYRDGTKSVRIYTQYGTVKNDFTINQDHAKLLYEALKEYCKQIE